MNMVMINGMLFQHQTNRHINTLYIPYEYCFIIHFIVVINRIMQCEQYL